jgi:hypothetical protein
MNDKLEALGPIKETLSTSQQQQILLSARSQRPPDEWKFYNVTTHPERNITGKN